MNLRPEGPLIARLRSRSAPRSLALPAMLARPSLSRSQARLGGAHQDPPAVLAAHDLVRIGVADGGQLVAVQLEPAPLALARLEHRRARAAGLGADPLVQGEQRVGDAGGGLGAGRLVPRG